MTRRNRTTNVLVAPFMSGNTIVKWLSHPLMESMKIDFRKEVDHWCKYEPTVLACDGTHIGVSIKNMNLSTSVTNVDDDDTQVNPSHKRLVPHVVGVIFHIWNSLSKFDDYGSSFWLLMPLGHQW